MGIGTGVSSRPSGHSPNVMAAVVALIGELKTSDLNKQANACEALGRLGADGRAALPELAEIYRGSFAREPGYPYPNRSAIRASVAICKQIEPGEAINSLQNLLIEGLMCNEPNVSRTAVGALVELAKISKLNVTSISALEELIGVQDHTSVRDRAGVLGVLLHAKRSSAGNLLENLVEKKGQVAARIDTIARPEDSYIGKTRDFCIRIDRPDPPGLIQGGEQENLLVIGPDRIRVLSRDRLSRGCACYFEGEVSCARDLYDSLVKKER